VAGFYTDGFANQRARPGEGRSGTVAPRAANRRPVPPWVSWGCSSAGRTHALANPGPGPSRRFRFFQYVEALYAAGITAGYGNGHLGVNDPISRGQMAAFLAKAFGLHWTNW